MTATTTMTKERILAVCRTNWEYRGVDEASVREMVDELAAHLQDAEAAGRTARDVVGGDVRAFAASWARARAPLPVRALRTASLLCAVVGFALLLMYVIRWTTRLELTAGDIAFPLAGAVATGVWEMRRGSLGFRRSWLIALVVGLPTVLLAKWLAGDEVLFTVELWAAPVLVLPGLPYIVGDIRARKGAAVPDAG